METKVQQRAMSRHGDGAMNTNRKRLSSCLPLAALAVGLGLAQPAHAQYSVNVNSDPGATENAQNIMTSNGSNTRDIERQISTAETDIIAALQQFAGQETVNSRAAVQASSQMMDTMDARETQRRIVDHRVSGVIAAMSGASTCNVLTGSVAASTAFSAPAQWREEIVNQQMSYFSGTSSKDKDQSLERLNQSHCAIGATAYDQYTGLCPTVTQPRQTTESGSVIDAPAVGRDLSATILLAPNSLTLSAADKAAANVFIVNALSGAPLAPMPKGAAAATAGNEGNRRVAAANNVAIARNSVASAVGASLLADDAALPGTGGTSGATQLASTTSSGAASTTGISEWAEGTAKQTIGYNQAGGNFPNGVSWAAYEKLRAASWFWNANWVSGISTHGGEQVVKDIAMIQAWSVYQNWQQQQQLKQMNLTLATMLAIMESQSRKTQ